MCLTEAMSAAVVFVGSSCVKVNGGEIVLTEETVSSTYHTSHVLYRSTREWIACDERLFYLCREQSGFQVNLWTRLRVVVPM